MVGPLVGFLEGIFVGVRLGKNVGNAFAHSILSFIRSAIPSSLAQFSRSGSPSLLENWSILTLLASSMGLCFSFESADDFARLSARKRKYFFVAPFSWTPIMNETEVTPPMKNRMLQHV